MIICCFIKIVFSDKINTEENEKNFVHNCNGLVF